MFSFCSTQWRVSAMGEKTGLDYSSVLAVTKWLGLKPTKKLLNKIRYLEIGALSAFQGKDLAEVLDG